MRHNPTNAIGYNDNVGPVQLYPFYPALQVCKNTACYPKYNRYWIFDDTTQKVFSMEILPCQFDQAEKLYLGGARGVIQDGMIYFCLAMAKDSMHLEDTPEKAYDRAMAIVGKR